MKFTKLFFQQVTSKEDNKLNIAAIVHVDVLY